MNVRKTWPLLAAVAAFGYLLLPYRLVIAAEPAAAAAKDSAAPLTLSQALALTLKHNPELSAFSHELRAGEATVLQAGVLPNPVLGIEADNLNNDRLRQDGDRTTAIQIGQLIELGGKRAARIRIAEAGRDLANWDYEAKRNIFMGRWDTPFKRTMLPTSFVGANVVGLWGSTFLLTAGSTSTLDGSSRALFQRRQSNTINYDSPVWNGFQVLAAVSSTNGATSATVAATAAKPRLWSLGAQYTSGLLYISGAYEKHSQFGAIGGANDDTGWHLGAAYTLMGKMKVAAFLTLQKSFSLGVDNDFVASINDASFNQPRKERHHENHFSENAYCSCTEHQRHFCSKRCSGGLQYPLDNRL